MCLKGLFKKENENRPAGNRIADEVFPAEPAGRVPSAHERELYALFAKEPIRLTREERALRAETEEAFLAVRQLLGECSVDIGRASALPLSLAKFLAVRGFRIRCIRTGRFAPEEMAEFAWLTLHFPDIRLAETDERADAALYLDGREPVSFDPETESLKVLALRMSERAGGMHFII